MAISQELRDTIIGITILTVLMLLLLGTGCTLFGSSTAPDLTNKLATDLRQTRREVNKVSQQYGDISGQLTTITNRVETNATEISTVSSNVSNINQNNTPFWQIFLPIAAAYFLWEVLKYKVIRRKKNA